MCELFDSPFTMPDTPLSLSSSLSPSFSLSLSLSHFPPPLFLSLSLWQTLSFSSTPSTMLGWGLQWPRISLRRYNRWNSVWCRQGGKTHRSSCTLMCRIRRFFPDNWWYADRKDFDLKYIKNLKYLSNGKDMAKLEHHKHILKNISMGKELGVHFTF